MAICTSATTTMSAAAAVASRRTQASIASQIASTGHLARRALSALVGERAGAQVGVIALLSDLAGAVEEAVVALVDLLGQRIALALLGDDFARGLAERAQHIVGEHAELHAVLAHQ